MNKVIKWILVIVMVHISVLVIMFYRSYNIDKGFKQIKIGDSESRVIALIGKPSKVIYIGEKKFWSSYIKGSIKEYHYEPNILPEIWVIGYDTKNNVIYLNHNLM